MGARGSWQEQMMITFNPKAMTQTLEKITEEFRENGGSPAALVQIERGNLGGRFATGVSDLESGAPARVNQTFETASQGKMMTAVAILQLFEEGKIDIDRPATDYLDPAITNGIANVGTATLRQMLNMTSGIPNYTDKLDENDIPVWVTELQQTTEGTFGPEDALVIARTMAATAEPGAEYNYSNTNYLLLGQVIEAITGQSFIAALQERVFDKAGMGDSGSMQGTRDDRLSSYVIDPETGTLVDVTRAPWETRGEAGVVTTTDDMIAFMKALLVDKTLLGTDALAQMTDLFVTDSYPGYEVTFGLGIVGINFTDGPRYVGFTGGSLGTACSTYMNVETGEIVSLAGTMDTFDSVQAAFELLQAVALAPSWRAQVDDGGPIRVASGSAAEMILTEQTDGLRFSLGGASMVLDRDLAEMTTDNLRFKDGSVLVVGDNQDGSAGDDAANNVNILRDFADANGRNNHLMGLAGDDILAGGMGGDAIRGGQDDDLGFGLSGADRLFGGAGSDQLKGGLGRDVITGGAGADLLSGGDGADRFVFRPSDTGSVDVITDFEAGIDLLSFKALTEGRLRWIGDDSFHGRAGEIRSVENGGGMRVEMDIDGDGAADLGIQLRKVTELAASDFLL
jgi:D-alanyl-D-alanine carboxypeptidase